MYDIEMHQMSPEFRACWHAAGRHLQHQADGRMFWLRAHPHPPVLEHLSFRLGNQLFFVRVEDESGEICGPGSLHGLFSVALEAKGCPCLLPMRRVRGGKWVADLPGWGLVLAGIGKAVDPVALITDKQIEMTEWELQEMAVQVVREHLEKKGFELMSWQGSPGVDPSIWFVGASGKPEWVVARPAKFPLRRAALPETLANIAASCRKVGAVGHFASVGIASVDQPFLAEDEPAVPLWRGAGMNIDFAGLERLKV